MGQLPTPKFQLVRKFSPCQKLSSKNTKFGADNPPLWVNLGARLKRGAPIISSVGNLQLFVGNLQLPAHLHFLTNNDAVSLHCKTVTTMNVATDDSSAQMCCSSVVTVTDNRRALQHCISRTLVLIRPDIYKGGGRGGST